MRRSWRHCSASRSSSTIVRARAATSRARSWRTRRADGYTLLLGNNSILATNATLYKTIGFDPEKDFAPISLIGTQGNVLVVNNNVPAHSLAELIALAKANPGKLNFASSGYGAAAHLAGELFRPHAHVDIVHVPYKGAAAALQDVIAGQDQMMFATTRRRLATSRAAWCGRLR